MIEEDNEENSNSFKIGYVSSVSSASGMLTPFVF